MAIQSDKQNEITYKTAGTDLDDLKFEDKYYKHIETMNCYLAELRIGSSEALTKEKRDTIAARLDLAGKELALMPLSRTSANDFLKSVKVILKPNSSNELIISAVDGGINLVTLKNRGLADAKADLEAEKTIASKTLDLRKIQEDLADKIAIFNRTGKKVLEDAEKKEIEKDINQRENTITRYSDKQHDAVRTYRNA